MIFSPYEIAFTILSPVIAIFISQKNLNRKLFIFITLVCVFVSWWFLFANDGWYDAKIIEEFEKIPNPSLAQIKEFDTDGASKAVTFIFGLPFALSYFAICFLMVKATKWISTITHKK